MGRKGTKTYPRTISEDLFVAWKKLKRKGDAVEIAEKLDYSFPVVSRALVHGYIGQFNELPDLINKFFMDRMQKEKDDAGKLNRMADSLARQ